MRKNKRKIFDIKNIFKIINKNQRKHNLSSTNATLHKIKIGEPHEIISLSSSPFIFHSEPFLINTLSKYL